MNEPTCPKCGRLLKELGERFGVCDCGYAFDYWLLREARFDEFDSATWFLEPEPAKSQRDRAERKEARQDERRREYFARLGARA